MRFKVTIDAVTGSNSEAPLHLGSVVITVADQEADTAKLAAENKAMDELWDPRLDSTSYPRVLIEEAPRYLVVDGWDHTFDGIGDRSVRFIYDYEAERLEHLQISHSVKGWLAANEAQRLDVEDSLKNANDDVLKDPDNWGYEASQELPDWCGLAEEIPQGVSRPRL